MDKNVIDRMLKPKSVAVVGASATPGKIGYTVVKNLLKDNYKGKIYPINQKEKEIIAYHEAGHALIASFLKNADPVQKVSIISRGQAGGYTMAVPTEDRRLHSKSYFVDELAVLLGGYVSEKVKFNDITTGASNDLERATQMAREMITRYGMSELGPRTFGKKEELIFLGKEINEEKNYSENTAQSIDGEVSRFIDDAYKSAEKIIKEKMDMLESIAGTLLKKETIEKEEFDQLIGKK